MEETVTEKIKKIRDQVAADVSVTKKVEGQSIYGRVARRTYQITQGFDWITARVYPVWRVTSWPFRQVIKGWFWLWDKMVHDDAGNFNKTLAGAFLFGSAVFAWFFLVPMLMFVLDCGLYLTTVKRDDAVYLFNSQEIDPVENVHSVQGCYKIPCSDADSIYFRIRPTWFNESWNIAHHGEPFFSDYVAAAIPITVSRCVITSYGFRMRLFMRGFNVYPDLLQSVCTPVGESATGVKP